MKKVIVNRSIYLALSWVLHTYDHDKDKVLSLHQKDPNAWGGNIAQPLNGMPVDQLKAMLDNGFEMEKPKSVSSDFSKYLKDLKELESGYAKALNSNWEGSKKPIQVSIELGQALDFVRSEYKQDKEKVLFAHRRIRGDYMNQAEPLNRVTYEELKTLLENGYYYAIEKREDEGMGEKIMVSEAVEQALDYLLYDRCVDVKHILEAHKHNPLDWGGKAQILNVVSYETMEKALKQGYWSAKTKAATELSESTARKVKGYFARKAENLAPLYERETNLDKRGLKELQMAFEDVADLTNDHVWMQELMDKADKRC